FPEVGNLLVIELKESGFREVEEGILVNLVLVESHDLVRVPNDADTCQFMKQGFDKLVRFGVVMLPGRSVLQNVARPVLLPVAAANGQSCENKLVLTFGPIGYCRRNEQSSKNHDHQ